MLMTNRNKRSVTLNLKTASGVDLAARLAGVADVLVENFSAGTMDRLGLGYVLMASARTGSAPPRVGNRAEDAAPQGCYRCAGTDEWCVISVRDDRQWRALVALTEAQDLRDARFAELAGRLEHQAHIDTVIERWTSERSSSEVEASLKAAGIPAERMRRTRDLLADPGAERLFPPVEDPPGYSQLMSRVPLTFGRGLPAPSRAPLVGEDTADVLREWLDLDPTALHEVEAEGALV
jgi:crotonobetainyl-CoA:carnitine CoA-transferase CaiB-like acyl-CoA transferase